MDKEKEDLKTMLRNIIEYWEQYRDKDFDVVIHNTKKVMEEYGR